MACAPAAGGRGGAVPGCAAQVLTECALLEGPRVADVVIDAAVGQPLRQAPARELVLERLAPDGAVAHARLGERTVEVEEAHEARPLPAPVRQRQDWPRVLRQPRQDVARVLPHGLGHDERHGRVDLPERLDAVDLAVEKAVLGRRVVGMPADDRAVEVRKGARQSGFEGLLSRPAHPVGREPGIPTRNEADFTRHGWSFRERGPPRRSRPAGRLAKVGRSRTT